MVIRKTGRYGDVVVALGIIQRYGRERSLGIGLEHGGHYWWVVLLRLSLEFPTCELQANGSEPKAAGREVSKADGPVAELIDEAVTRDRKVSAHVWSTSKDSTDSRVATGE